MRRTRARSARVLVTRVLASPRAIAFVQVTAMCVVAVAFAFMAPRGADAQSRSRVNARDLTQVGLEATASTAGLGAEAPELPTIIGNVIYAALSLTGIVFVILMIYGGFMWMNARGNQADIDKAKKIIESAIIGVVIIGLAFAITSFVIRQIGQAQDVAAPAGSP